MKALSHYYAALVHMTIVRQLKNSEKKDCKSNIPNGYIIHQCTLKLHIFIYAINLS